MIDKKLVQNKLVDLEKYYQELGNILVADNLDIIKDHLKLRSVERLFQLIVDTTIDINTHIIAESNIGIPDDYQSTFITLAENDILPMEFAMKIAPAVGLRNKVVHKYGKVGIKSMVDDIRNEIKDFLKYAELINDFLRK